jgi:hypothetical protein
MKKILHSLLALCAATSLWAVRFQSGLLYYNTLAGDSTVEVTFQTSHSDSNNSIAGQNYTTLKAVTIPETVTYNSKTYTVVAIGKQTFARKPSSNSAAPLHNQNNNTLSLVNIPKTIKTIGDYAFYRCTALTTINFLGDGLTTIGAYAFYGTSSLSKIVFPETLKTIGAYAFFNSEPNASGIRGLKDTLVIPNTVNGLTRNSEYERGYIIYFELD